MAPRDTLTPGRVMIYTACVLFVVGLAWLFWNVRPVVIVVLLGIIFAAAIEPFVNRLRRVGLSRGQAILTCYLAVFLILGGIGWIVFPPMVKQGQELFNDVPRILDNLEEQAASNDSRFVRDSGVRAIHRARVAFEEYQANPPVEGETAIRFLQSTFGVLFSLFSMLIVAFYWLSEKAIIKRLLLGLVPLKHRDEAHSIWDEIEQKLGGWTRGQAILCLSIGAMSGLAYWAIGLEFWLPLAIFAGVTELIPIIGPIVAGAAAAVIAVTDSWQKALLVIAIVFIIQQLESAVLVPRVMRDSVGLSPLTVIIAVIVGSTLMGILGAILAIPVAAAVQVVVTHLVALRIGRVDVLAPSMEGADRSTLKRTQDEDDVE